MPQKLIFDGPGYGAESTEWAGWDDHNKTHFYFQIAQSDQTRYTGERITRESVQKWGKSIYDPTVRIKFQKLQILHFSHFLLSILLVNEADINIWAQSANTYFAYFVKIDCFRNYKPDVRFNERWVSEGLLL